MVVEEGELGDEMNEKEIESNAKALIARVKSFHVETAAQYEEAATLLLDVKRYVKSVHEAFDSIVEAAHKVHKEAIAKRKRYLDPAEKAEMIIKHEMLRWDVEQERIRRERESMLQAEAKKRAEEEALNAAIQAEAEGDIEAAEEILSEPVVAPIVMIQTETPKVAGVSHRTEWDFRIVSITHIKDQYKIPDEKKIRSVVKALGKQSEGVVGGIQVFERRIVSARV